MSIPMPNTRIARGNLRSFIPVERLYHKITIEAAEEQVRNSGRTLLRCECSSLDEPLARPISLKFVYPLGSDETHIREILDRRITELIHWADIYPGDGPEILIGKTGLAEVTPENGYNSVRELILD